MSSLSEEQGKTVAGGYTGERVRHRESRAHVTQMDTIQKHTSLPEHCLIKCMKILHSRIADVASWKSQQLQWIPVVTHVSTRPRVYSYASGSVCWS